MSETVTMTLTEFLLARIAEDETVAASAGDSCGRREGALWTMLKGWVNGGQVGPRGSVEATPARVLAECEAKRRILERADRLTDDSELQEIGWELLGYLALPYADHEDFRDEWSR